jgi:hypothetical protein
MPIPKIDWDATRRAAIGGCDVLIYEVEAMKCNVCGAEMDYGDGSWFCLSCGNCEDNDLEDIFDTGRGNADPTNEG